MKESMRDGSGITGSTDRAESTSDYRIRELEARLSRRVEALEAQRVRLGWMARLMGGGFLATIVALGFVLAQGLNDGDALATGSLFAREVVLRDGEGLTRGRLGTDADGHVEFSLTDRDGRERIRLAVLPDGSPGLTITDAETRPRAVLGFLPDGTTSLVFADGRGTSRAVVGLGADGSTHALFTDQAGTVRTLVGVEADGAPSVSVFEGTGGQASTDALAGH